MSASTIITMHITSVSDTEPVPEEVCASAFVSFLGSHGLSEKPESMVNQEGKVQAT